MKKMNEKFNVRVKKYNNEQLSELTLKFFHGKKKKYTEKNKSIRKKIASKNFYRIDNLKVKHQTII